MLSDLRYALRALGKAPGFTAIAVLTLALGVGANTTIFSVINAVLLHPFPYRESGRLYFIGSTRVGQDGLIPVTYPDYCDWVKAARSFDGLAFATGRTYTLTKVAEPAVIRGAAVSASAWPLLGMAPALGRTFTVDEDRPGASPVCVLSYATWEGRLGGDPGIVGRTLTLDGRAYTVIGVMPPEFKFWAGDVWLPVGLEADTEMMRSRVLRMDEWVVGRPRPGVTIEAAVAELNVIAAQLALEHPESNKGTGAGARLLSDSVTGPFQRPLLVLFAAVGCVLLIACANVANLLLARAATREHEYAVRLALGATRGRLIRQMLLEALPIAVLGGLAGVLLGAWGLQALLAILPRDAVPVEAEITVSAPVMLFSLGAVLVTMLVFTLFPAFQCSNPPLTQGLQESGGRGTAGARTARVRAALVLAEISLSVTLLVGAGLLIRSLAKVYYVDPGFNRQNLLVIPIQLPLSRYPSSLRATAFFEDVLQNVRRLPRIKAAAASTNVPFTGGSGIPLLTEGRTYRDINDLRAVQFAAILGDYFPALGLQVIRGRTFTPADDAGSASVIILNEAAVQQFLPDGDPLGKRVMLGVPANLIKPGLLPTGLDKFQWATVVGVVRSTRHFGLQADPPPSAFIPIGQSWDLRELRSSMTLVLRTAGDPLAAIRDVRPLIAAADRDQPLGRIGSMEQIIRDSLTPSRFNAILLGLFAALALALAVIGVYGVMAWNVARRTREFGIRQALGAGTADVLKLVVIHGLKLVGAGIGVGLAGALVVSRLLQSMLFNVSAFDPVTFAAVAAVLGLTALLACVVPARRATRVDPVTALRTE